MKFSRGLPLLLSPSIFPVTTMFSSPRGHDINVLSDFKHISGDLHVTIVQSYCSSFYGSQLWDIYIYIVVLTD